MTNREDANKIEQPDHTRGAQAMPRQPVPEPAPATSEPAPSSPSPTREEK